MEVLVVQTEPEWRQDSPLWHACVTNNHIRQGCIKINMYQVEVGELREDEILKCTRWWYFTIMIEKYWSIAFGGGSKQMHDTIQYVGIYVQQGIGIP